MFIDKSSKELYEEYKDIAQKAADLYYASAVLGWDQEVFMPPKGFPYRGRQLATLASLAHEMMTSESYGNVLEELSGRNDLSENEAANIRLSLEDFEKKKKLSSSFVNKLTQQVSSSYDAWIKSRKENSYKVYEPELTKMIELKLQQADMYGYEGNSYDALLDEYEKGATVAMLDPVFEQVKNELPSLLEQISNAEQVDDAFMNLFYAKDKQWDFSIDVLKKIGYDFDAGRQDISEHPFTTSFAPEDVRVTTRVSEHDFASLLWSSIHEGGHALYEQGLPSEQYGLPLGEAASLAVHESQSRLWENNVGRGIHFWQHFYPVLKGYFSEQLNDVTLDGFYKGMNKVQPSLIRTESDELTYHFHVLIRYEIEKALLNKELQPKDLASAWNSQYEKYLNITPPDDKQGVLQDVHWAHGSFGYFPTYSLGSFYAAQYYEQAKKELSGLESQLSAGEYGKLLTWLRGKIHVHGRKYRSNELCKSITGEGLSFSAFMKYAQEKYSFIYNLD
ncbi:MAG: carboxypeptidase M32 [Chitinophagales bacterium]|nr:carboxypeptidase M32 [Chitinophagaceae bacterium]MCB9064770.1 carboxypeptidase M32 [Chitinophagales bacterium]